MIAVQRSLFALSVCGGPIRVPKSRGHAIRCLESLPSELLIDRAKQFVAHKNDGNLPAIFDMCAADANVYGLQGKDIAKGLTDFFAEHEGLYHTFLAEPTVVGPRSVQYTFEKSWTQAGELKRWLSVDPSKPRNKVELLEFDADAQLTAVSVVEAVTT